MSDSAFSAVPMTPAERAEMRYREEQRRREYAEMERRRQREDEFLARQVSMSPLYPTKGIREGDHHLHGGFPP